MRASATEAPVSTFGTFEWWAGPTPDGGVVALACQEQCSSQGGSGGNGTCCWQDEGDEFLRRARHDRS